VDKTYRQKYVYVGLLGGGYFFDERGRETAENVEVQRRIAAAERAAAELAEDVARHPNCASRRTRGERTVACKGGRVLLRRRTSPLGARRGNAQVPRRRRTPAGEERCACVTPGAGLGEVYDGCAEEAGSCVWAVS